MAAKPTLRSTAGAAPTPARRPREPRVPTSCLVRARPATAGAAAKIVRAHRRYGGCLPRMELELLRLKPWQRHVEVTSGETLWVILHGFATATAGGRSVTLARRSVFDEQPAALHAGVGERIALQAGPAPTELAVVRAGASRLRGIRWSEPTDCRSENRGAGLVQGGCERIVRTLFDHDTRPESNLVVGEVVNFPGRWSSYPPHHHPQAEIYHYRFTEPHGYGHAELGDAVLKVRNGDTVVIPGGLDHAQVSAPGYGMYYLWIVRHLPRRPYRGFTFTPEHAWLLDPARQGWRPAP